MFYKVDGMRVMQIRGVAMKFPE